MGKGRARSSSTNLPKGDKKDGGLMLNDNERMSMNISLVLLSTVLIVSLSGSNPLVVDF